MNTLLEKAFSSAVEWLFRRRSPALAVMRAGFGCLTLAFAAGFALKVSLPLAGGQVDLKYDGGDGVPQMLVYVTGILGLVLTTAGAGWEGARYIAERQAQTRKKVIAVEVRGLRNVNGVPLVESIPAEIPGRREQLLIDLRQYIQDGAITDLAAAIAGVTGLPDDLRRREAGLDRSDITCVYGGLAPVPLTFLTGVLADDEGQFVIMDWDRHAGRWRSLGEPDDLKRFVVSGMEVIPAGSSEAALSVSVSYGIDLKDVRSRAGDMPIVEAALEGGNTDAHWSGDKMAAVGRQFLEILGVLNRRGVKRVHLFLAAQNSVVFRFGRLYDKRNLPEIVVYQFDRGKTPAYQWGLLMPVAGVSKSEILS